MNTVNSCVPPKNYLYILVSTVILFFYVYDCYFSFLPITTNNILGILGIIVFPYTLLSKTTFPDSFFKLVLFFLVLWVYALVSLLINQTSDFSFIQYELIRPIFLPFFAAYFVAYVLIKEIKSIEFLLKIMLFLSVFQCGLVIMSFLNSSVKDFLISIQNIGEREVTYLIYGMRAIGLGIRFDFGSMYLSIAMLVCVYLYLQSNGKILYMILWLLELIAAIFMARSIVVGVVLSLLMYSFYEHDIKAKIKFISVVCFVLLVFVVMLLNFMPNFFSQYSDYFNWFFQYLGGSSQNADTLKTLSENMYFFPDSCFTFLFGDGRFQNELGRSYMSTDPLVMRHILYGGVLGLSLYLSFIIALFCDVKKMALLDLQKDNNYYFVKFLNFLLCLLILFYFKLDFHYIKFPLLFYCFFWLKNNVQGER